MHSYNLKKLDKVIKHFKNAKILVVGDLMIDRFIWGTVSRISPEAPVPVVWAKSESFMPGAASNVANNICALGAKAYMCGVIGNDQDGKTLLDELTGKDIDNEGIIVDNSRPTINKTRIIAYHQQVCRLDKESEKALDANIIDRMLSYAENKIPDVDAVIIEDYGKGVVVPRLITRLLKAAKKYKKVITVDPKEDHFRYYKNVTVITPNRKESEIGSGIKINDIDSLKKAGRKLLGMLDSDAVLITLGEDGMALFRNGGGWVHIPTVAQEVYDVSGAGDTVIAAFTLAKVSGASMAEAAYISNVAAGVVVGKVGIAVCMPEELKSRLNQIGKYGLKRKRGSYPSESLFKE